MGVVFLARDPLIGRLVALKTFRIGYSVKDQEMEQFRIRFMREAQSAGILTHPNIVTIHDVVEASDEGLAFIAMEYVRGTNLKLMLQGEQPLSLSRGARRHRPGGGGARLRPRQPGGAPRRQAGEHPDHHRQQGEDHRLRHRPARQLEPHPGGAAPRHAELHGARADPGQGGRPPRRPLLARRRALRDAHPPQAVPGREPDRGEPPHRLRPLHPAARLRPRPPSGVDRILGRALEKDPAKRYQRAREMVDDLRRVVEASAPSASNETQSLSSTMVLPPAPIPSPSGPPPGPRPEWAQPRRLSPRRPRRRRS